jgi:hypothetical protein
MARVNHQAGIISLFIILVVVIASSSFLIKFISRSLSGFEDAPAMVSNGPSCVVDGNQAEPSYVPDRNTYYMCNTLRDGTTCPEGTFCNGVADKCTPISVAMYADDVEGYYT